MEQSQVAAMETQQGKIPFDFHNSSCYIEATRVFQLLDGIWGIENDSNLLFTGRKMWFADANTLDYENMDDATFVKYLRRCPGDQRAWETLFERYHRLIWYYIPQGLESSEDLYQEIQLAIWNGLLHSYKGTGSVISYVVGVIRNQRSSYMRSSRSYQNLDEIADTFPDDAPSPLDTTIHEESADLVLDLLQRLKEKERDMLILQYLKYRHSEIIHILNIRSVGASRKFLSKLMDKIQDLCQSLKVDADQFSEGINILCREGKLHEMLSC